LEVSSWFIKGAQTALGIGPLTSAVYTQAAILGGVAGGAAFGASNTLLHGSSFSQALDNGLKGAFAGTITGGITGYYGNTWSVERISTSAFAGGASAEMLGGDFKDGFKMALVSSSLRYVYNKMVKYDIDARAGSKGGAADIKGKKGPPIKDYINIGVQDAAGIIPGTLKVILAQPPISPNAIWNISCNPATALIPAGKTFSARGIGLPS
jgi:hypothetical protein